MNAPVRHLATVRNHNQLLAVFRSRIDELEITRQTIDSEGHLPPGYSAKLLGPLPLKRLGRSSLGAMLGVLRLALVVVEDVNTAPLPKRRYRRAQQCSAARTMPDRVKR